ncbi:MAG: hypothetical protein HQL27_07705, partial [Candidatus Omnitrophica bacterium]|nr:hypothetical protein [Candidatus Omnitrophota bacterium]
MMKFWLNISPYFALDPHPRVCAKYAHHAPPFFGEAPHSAGPKGRAAAFRQSRNSAGLPRKATIVNFASFYACLNRRASSCNAKFGIKLIPRQLWYLLAIMLIGLSCYSNSFSVPFQFDDSVFIENNQAIKSFDGLSVIWKKEGIKSRIVCFFSFYLNYKFNKLDPFGFHLVNFFIHLLNSSLVFLIAKLFFSSEKTNQGYIAKGDEPYIAFFVALAFLSHPVQTQAVTYISQRFASLATFFYLFAFFCYLRVRLIARNKREKIILGALVLISGLVSLFVKEIAFTLPITIAMTEAVFFRKEVCSGRKNWFHVAVFSLGAIGFLLIVPSMFSFDIKTILLSEIQSASHEGDIANYLNYFLTQLRVITVYLRLLFFPLNLALDYDFPLSKDFLELPTFLGFALISLMLLFAARYLKRCRMISFGIFWFYITLCVESSIIPIRHVIFEHRVYLPSFGIVFAAILLLYKM